MNELFFRWKCIKHEQIVEGYWPMCGWCFQT